MVGWGKKLMKGKVRQDEFNSAVRVGGLSTLTRRTEIFLPCLLCPSDLPETEATVVGVVDGSLWCWISLPIGADLARKIWIQK